jgi:DNA-binding transcriptional MerR regulator
MDKSPDAFRTISEVADDLDVPQHVLRFWETRFAHIKPLKRGGGRRYYRPDDVDLLKGIRQLLYGRGYTIKGVQRILKEDGIRFVQSVGRGEQAAAPPPPGSAAGEDHAFDGDAGEDEPEIAAGSPGTRRDGGTTASAAEAGVGSDAGLSNRQLERLRSALDDLVECERVLAALKAADEPPLQ